MKDTANLIAHAEALLARLEQLLPAGAAQPDWEKSIAFRWRKRGGAGFLQPVLHPHKIALKDLQGIAEQKKLVERNTRQFVEGRQANNVLLTGAHGTGKSSLVKAVFSKYASRGLRLIEVAKHDLMDLPDIIDLLFHRPERFILYCDDLSFEADEPGYTALKALLDGSITALPDNVVIYATSNRRHLMPEYMEENLQARHVGLEVHPGEAVEEKISLSERFGLWVSFYPFNQEDYLAIAEYWVERMGVNGDVAVLRQAALRWALTRGSRSGRVAWQFARDWAGQQKA